MLKILVVGLGGFVGAVTRFGISGWVNEKFEPRIAVAGTLAVNAFGCLMMGVLMVVVDREKFFSENARLFLMVGLLGSLTTFSTFSAETIKLVDHRDWRMATFNVVANVVVSITAVVVGRLIAKSLLP